MAEPNDLDIILLDNIIQQTKHNNTTLNEFLYYTYPSNDIKKLIINLIIAIDRVLIKLNELRQRIEIGEPEINIGNEVKLYSTLLMHVNKLYEFIEVSRVENVPESKTYLLDFFTRPIDPESIFIIIPTHDDNFKFVEISSWLNRIFRSVVDVVDDIFPISDKKFSIIMFPYAYKHTLFSNILLSHEVGHFIFIEHNPINPIFPNIHIDRDRIHTIAHNEIIREYPNIERPLDLFGNWDAVLIAKNADVLKTIRNWLKELFCDLIAFKMVGPVFITSFIDFILTKTVLTEISKKHPPPILRLKVLLQAYEDSGYKEAYENSESEDLVNFHNMINNIKENFEQVNVSDDTLGEEYYYIYEIIMEQLNNLKAISYELAERLEIVYNHDVLINEAEPLINSLSELIIPCEIKRGVPANPNSILNTGTYLLLVKFNEIFNQYEPMINYDKDHFKFLINSLVIKGLESCLIQRKLGVLL